MANRFIQSRVIQKLFMDTYINAGSQIDGLDSIAGIFSAKKLFSFALLGIFPLPARKLLTI